MFFMPTASVALVGSGHGALSGVLGVVLKALIWSTVARVVWHSPLALVAVLVAVVCALVLVRHIRRAD